MPNRQKEKGSRFELATVKLLSAIGLSAAKVPLSGGAGGAFSDEPPVKRPALRWHGGKWRLAPWIISHFPEHRTYVEPFGGAASVLLRKKRSYAEVYNDLDDWVVNLFRVLRDESLSAQLIEALVLTPFARKEFDATATLGAIADPVEMARLLIARSFMGFGSSAHNGRSTGFRANSNRSGTTPAHDWMNYPETLGAIVQRLRGVIVENRDAVQVMQAHDGADTLHYVDPPYLHETRTSGNRYRHEMNDSAHENLLFSLKSLSGIVIISGYQSKMYETALAGWTRIDKDAYADGALKRIESLWLNPACVDALTKERMMPNRQKEKGSRFELATVKLLSAIGLSAAKVPLSGGAGGAFCDDIVLKWFDGAEARFEAKARANGFKQIYGWLGECSGLFLKADRKPPLVVLRMEDFCDLMRRAHANEK